MNINNLQNAITYNDMLEVALEELIKAHSPNHSPYYYRCTINNKDIRLLSFLNFINECKKCNYKQLIPFDTHVTLVEDNEHFLYICKVKIIFTNDKNMSCKRISYKYLLFLNLNKGLFKSFSEKTFNQLINYNMLKFDENENKYK